MYKVLPRFTTPANNTQSYSINNQKESSYQGNNPSISQANFLKKNDFAYSSPGNNVRYQFRSPILEQATAKAKENQSGSIFKMFGMA
jgi:hypothetical protein